MALSIEIRNNEVYLIDSKVTKSKVSIRKTHMFPFDPDYLDQTGIINKENFSLLLNQHLEAQEIKEKSCTICLNNSSIIYRELYIPKVDDKKLHLLVRSEMMSVLNLTPDYIMDFIVLEEVVKDEDPMYRVLAVAVIDKAIASYLETMKMAGLKVDIIDSATNAMIKLLDYADVTNTSHQLIVADVGNGYVRLYLFDDGLYVLSRNIKLPDIDDSNHESLLATVEENISKMVQFSYTRNTKGISNIILVGHDNLLQNLKTNVTESLGITCDVFSDLLQQQSIEGFQNTYVNTLGVLLRK
jgi:type IV pilus assembly protein PilM